MGRGRVEGGDGSDCSGGGGCSATGYPQHVLSSIETVEVLTQEGGVGLSAVGTMSRSCIVHFFRVVI